MGIKGLQEALLSIVPFDVGCIPPLSMSPAGLATHQLLS
jgi:hypothetical protein